MVKPVKKKRGQARPAKQVPFRSLKRKRDQGFEIAFDPVRQLNQKTTAPPMGSEAFPTSASPEVLNRLWSIIESRRDANPEISHSARLLSKGVQRIAQKLGEEAVECLLEVTAGNRVGVISESADVLYHLLVAWVSAGITPEEVWHELANREKVSRMSGTSEMSLGRLVGTLQVGTTKIP